jgi:hypothetical protein
MVTPTAAVVAAAPVGQSVMVTIPTLDGGARRYGPAKGYKPHPDGTAAKRGDACVVVADNAGQLWLLAWEVS